MSLDAVIGYDIGGLTLDLTLACEGTTVIMGPNGAGKTTLLRLLLGARTPSRGRVVLDDRTLFDHDRGIDRPPEERQIAYVPQGFGLFPHLTALENVMFAIPEGDPIEQRLRARALLRELHVVDAADRRPNALSGGEQQRVALARAMAARPRLLLLDEPLSALDPGVRPRVRRALGEWLRGSGLPSVVVTHDPSDARELADHLVVLEGGRVTQRGTVDEVAVRPASEFVAALTAGLIERGPSSDRPPSLVSEDE